MLRASNKIKASKKGRIPRKMEVPKRMETSHLQKTFLVNKIKKKVTKSFVLTTPQSLSPALV